MDILFGLLRGGLAELAEYLLAHFMTCLVLAVDLAKGKCRLEECPILDQTEFVANRQALTKLLE